MNLLVSLEHHDMNAHSVTVHIYVLDKDIDGVFPCDGMVTWNGLLYSCSHIVHVARAHMVIKWWMSPCIITYSLALYPYTVYEPLLCLYNV